MARNRNDDYVIENAQLIYLNFSGKVDQFNPLGKKEFSIRLEESDANRLMDLGWNVKRKEPKEEGDEPFWHLPVEARWNKKPPKIVMINSKGRRTYLTENTVMELDHADIVNCDVILNPFEWEAAGKTGTKAYLKTMFVKIQEDYLDAKYGPDPDDEPAGE